MADFEGGRHIAFIPTVLLKNICPEFLTGAAVRLRNKFQMLCKIWVFERKNALFNTFLPLFVDDLKFVLCFMPFCLRKICQPKFWPCKRVHF